MSDMTTRSQHALRRFVRDNKAGAAMIFGLAAVPTIALMGFAVDYSVGLAGKAKLDVAADAASMVAITTAKTVIQGGQGASAAIAQGQTAAQAAFKANAGSIGYTSVPVPTVVLARDSQNPQKLTATVSYTTSTTTNFSTIFGLKQMNLTGTSTSTLTMPTYINYYIITDISQSMGVGSTTSDMQNLYSRVIQYKNYDTPADASAQIGCVFGCHVPQTPGGNYTQPDSNENLAHLPKYGAFINLRIDAAKSAIQTIVSDAQTANAQSGLNLIQIGVYTMQQDPQNPGSYIQTISSPPSSNFSTVSTQVATMDLGNNNGGGTGDTSFSNSLGTFTSSILNQQGDGSTQANALNYVFLITDGISDVPGNCTDGHCTGAFDNNLCASIKAKATVGVIYTTYNPIYIANNPSNNYVDTYRDLVAPYIANVPGNLQFCSSGAQYYFEATDGPSITTGMQKLFAPTALQARITN